MNATEYRNVDLLYPGTNSNLLYSTVLVQGVSERKGIIFRKIIESVILKSMFLLILSFRFPFFILGIVRKLK